MRVADCDSIVNSDSQRNTRPQTIVHSTNIFPLFSCNLFFSLLASLLSWGFFVCATPTTSASFEFVHCFMRTHFIYRRVSLDAAPLASFNEREMLVWDEANAEERGTGFESDIARRNKQQNCSSIPCRKHHIVPLIARSQNLSYASTALEISIRSQDSGALASRIRMQLTLELPARRGAAHRRSSGERIGAATKPFSHHFLTSHFVSAVVAALSFLFST